jgi:peptide-methionine (S)-S-oxide reductase
MAIAHQADLVWSRLSLNGQHQWRERPRRGNFVSRRGSRRCYNHRQSGLLSETEVKFTRTFFWVMIMGLSSFFSGGCEKPAQGHGATGELPQPAVDLAADASAKPGEQHTIVVAGGCFWCVEGVFLQLKGVTAAVSGYAGGTKETANYDTVCTGTTGHAESVKITYDPSKITYGQLMRVLFTVIDPTTKDAQGPDHGTQYRSAIFYQNEEEKKVAEAYIKQLDAAKVYEAPIVTTLEPLKIEAFYPAEGYHQNYVACHLRQPYVQQAAIPKIEKVREKFKDQVKPEPAGK